MHPSHSNTSVSQANQNQPLAINQEVGEEQKFHYWQGASGKYYIHTVYSLFNCPELPKTNYILVNRNGDGNCAPLIIGETTSNAESLILAFLRQNAAKHNANEIHIHVMTNNKYERDMVRLDLLGCQSINGQRSKLAASTP